MDFKLWIVMLLSMGCFGGLCHRYGEETVMAWIFLFAVLGVVLSFLGFAGVSPSCQP